MKPPSIGTRTGTPARAPANATTPRTPVTTLPASPVVSTEADVRRWSSVSPRLRFTSVRPPAVTLAVSVVRPSAVTINSAAACAGAIDTVPTTESTFVTTEPVKRTFVAGRW